MKVGVTGYGVVGRATADVLRRLGHDVVIHDIAQQALEAARLAGYGMRHEAEGVEVDFICVPETVLDAALDSIPAGSLVVVRSTVTPGTTDRLSVRSGRPLLFMPEFLKEATAQWDALNPPFILIGAHDKAAADLVAGLFAPLLSQTVIVTPAIAEMVKLSLNAYLHTIISFWNEVHLICERIGLPSHVVGKLCSLDPRVAAYGAVMHGQPVGGRCLPKDLAQLIEFAESVAYDPELLRQVQRVNEKLLPLTAHPPAANGYHPVDVNAELASISGISKLSE